MVLFIELSQFSLNPHTASCSLGLLTTNGATFDSSFASLPRIILLELQLIQFQWLLQNGELGSHVRLERSYSKLEC